MSAVKIKFESSDQFPFDKFLIVDPAGNQQGPPVSVSDTPQEVNLRPGIYRLQIESGVFSSWAFRVTDISTFEFDQEQFGGFLDGNGTDTLTIRGFEMTFDARDVSGRGVQLNLMNLRREFEFISSRTFRLFPQQDYQVIHESGSATDFRFNVEFDGTFSYDAELDISQDGFLVGQNTPSLQFLGYVVGFDVRAAGVPLISNVNQIVIDRTGLLILLPASYELESRSPVKHLKFTVERKGDVSIDTNLSDINAKLQDSTLRVQRPVV